MGKKKTKKSDQQEPSGGLSTPSFRQTPFTRASLGLPAARCNKIDIGTLRHFTKDGPAGRSGVEQAFQETFSLAEIAHQTNNEELHSQKHSFDDGANFALRFVLLHFINDRQNKYPSKKMFFILESADKSLSVAFLILNQLDRILDPESKSCSGLVLPVQWRVFTSSEKSLRDRAGQTYAEGMIIQWEPIRIVEQFIQMLQFNMEDLEAPFEVTPGFLPSFLCPLDRAVEREDDPKEATPLCVCGAPGGMRCSRCHSQYYCGVACQKKDWKTHKATCVAPTEVTQSIPTVSGNAREVKTEVPSEGEYYDVCVVDPNHDGDRVMSTISFTGSRRNMCGPISDLTKPMQVRDGTQMVVKIQIPIGQYGRPMLCYNQDRSVQRYLEQKEIGGEKGYQRIWKLVEERGVMPPGFPTGAKAFLNAVTRDEGRTIRLYVNNVVTPCAW